MSLATSRNNLAAMTAGNKLPGGNIRPGTTSQRRIKPPANGYKSIARGHNQGWHDL